MFQPTPDAFKLLPDCVHTAFQRLLTLPLMDSVMAQVPLALPRLLTLTRWQ